MNGIEWKGYNKDVMGMFDVDKKEKKMTMIRRRRA